MFTTVLNKSGINRSKRSLAVADMRNTLGRLRKLKPLQKPALIKACAATILADGHVSVDEGALLQGIAATLDCPLPPGIFAQTTQEADAQVN